MRISFHEVAIYSEKSCKCKKCGKRIKRKQKFYQTLNPWNKNSKGEVKSRLEIEKEILAQSEKWYTQDELCRKCGAGNES